MSYKEEYRKLQVLLGNSLSDIPSERFYDELNNNYFDLWKHNSKCAEVYKIHKKIRNKKICEKILRHLENSTVSNNDNSGYDDCLLLKYWIYSVLEDIFGSEDTSHIGNAFAGVQYIWNYIVEYPNSKPYNKKCKQHFDVFDYDDWKNRKELYDYYVDFRTLFDTAMRFDLVCEEYYRKIEEKIPLYKRFEEICSDQSKCPEFYEKYQPYNPKSVLSKLPCHDKIEKARAAEASPKTSILQHGVGLELGPQSNSYDTGMTQGSSEIGKNIGHSVLGVAPVLLTATALYRYTPIGSWIRNLGGNTTNSISNMEAGEMEPFLPSTQESGNVLFGNTENYISYQPM
ncbi:PIR Superfamily Protein [Plasmodium ovale curtisi]|uniref:PIR Superfamily Protein n=2 Tax=Plasmodium ovale curtisi TaxID=864141 RepID=A0A1A8X8N3_PLAOA|nr:PIR Superfamily Protein [Plasmodium ovale curtisi]